MNNIKKCGGSIDDMVYIVSKDEPLIEGRVRKIQPHHKIVIFNVIEKYTFPLISAGGKSVFHDDVEKIIFNIVNTDYNWVRNGKSCLPPKLKMIIFPIAYNHPLVYNNIRVLPDGVETVIFSKRYNKPIIINGISIFPESVKTIYYGMEKRRRNIYDKITEKIIKIPMRDVKSYRPSWRIIVASRGYTDYEHPYPFKISNYPYKTNNSVYGFPRGLQMLIYDERIILISKMRGLPRGLKVLHLCQVPETSLAKLRACEELLDLKICHFGMNGRLYTECDEKKKYSDIRYLPPNLKIVSISECIEHQLIINGERIFPENIISLSVFGFRKEVELVVDDLNCLPNAIKYLSIEYFGGSLLNNVTRKSCLPESLELLSCFSLEKTLDSLIENKIPFNGFLPATLKCIQLARFIYASNKYFYPYPSPENTILPAKLEKFSNSYRCICRTTEDMKKCFCNNYDYRVFPEGLNEIYFPLDTDDYVKINKVCYFLQRSLPLPIAEEVIPHIYYYYAKTQEQT